MKRTIESIKVWKQNDKTRQNYGEYRIYIRFTNGSSGCYYLTGSKWNKKGSLENLSTEELAEAKKLAVRDKSWHTVYDLAGKAVDTRQTKCPPPPFEQPLKITIRHYRPNNNTQNTA